MMICAPSLDACSISARDRSTFGCTPLPGMASSCNTATLIILFDIFIPWL